MIVDHRTYELQPRLPMKVNLGRLAGYFTTEVGNVNVIARNQKSCDFMKTMNNKILVPTSFSPTK